MLPPEIGWRRGLLMKFVLDDGGRAAAGFKGHTGDCVVRSIAIAANLPYLEVYKALSEGCRNQRLSKRSSKKSSARDGVHVSRKWFKIYMEKLGWKWTPCMGIGTGCKVHLVDGELPMGRLIVSVSKHYTAVIDGVIHDTHDPQRSTETVDVCNQVVSVAHRCVYGYWSKT
jgi:hypothetical protein